VALSTAVSKLGFSARGVHRVIKVARTIADLAGEPEIRLGDLTEALSLRTLDRPTC
jgi:magnesium chelatase family protein